MTECRHYFSFIEDIIRLNGNAPAISDYDEDIHFTYNELHEEVSRIALWLKGQGIEPGDKVAICGRSSSHWALCYIAVAALRGVVVSILPDFTADNILYLVSHSDSKLLLAGANVCKKLEAQDCGDIKYYNLEALEIDHTAEVERIKLPTDNLDELVLINYTSGTTDKPKGVMLTNRALSSNVTYAQETLHNHVGDSIVSMLPLAHIFGLMFDFLYQLAGGVHVVFMKRTPTPSMLIRAFAEVKPYMILTVPLVIEKIIINKVFPVINKAQIKMLWYTPTVKYIVRNKVKEKLIQTMGGKLRFLIIGGAAINPQVEKCLRQIKFPYTVGYGMTECGPLVGYEDWWNFKKGTVGKLVNRLQMRIDSTDSYTVPGEILLKGESLFSGYYKNEEANSQAFDQFGWFHTGDMGIVDREGNIVLKGRCKNMILGPSGQNIYPEEIETKLNLLDKVIESVVVERAGKLIALVYPDYEQLDREKIREEVGEWLMKINKELPNYSQLAKIELMEEEFEKTPKKSIKRFMYK